MCTKASIAKALASIVLLLTPQALAQSSDPIDIGTLDQEARDGILGAWTIADQSGSRICRVTFSDEATIGGYAIDLEPSCLETFPIMNEIGSWRLYENWEIVLADATRKELIRFSTPDNSYVATPETDGIFTIRRPE